MQIYINNETGLWVHRMHTEPNKCSIFCVLFSFVTIGTYCPRKAKETEKLASLMSTQNCQHVWSNVIITSFYLVLGTQRVISFLRQIVEHGGFYRTSDQAWVTMERIQFVGACNPPTDPGRKPLSHRFVLVSLTLHSLTLLWSQWWCRFVEM